MIHNRSLESKEEYKLALKRTIEIFHAEEGSSDDKELDTLLFLVKEYEERNYYIPEPNNNN